MAGFAAYHLGTKADIPSETKKINDSTDLMSSD
jgi:hypothetical protein